MKQKFRSFSGRLTRRIIVVMLVTMTIVAGLIFFFAAFGMYVVTNLHYQDLHALTNERLSAVLDAVEVSAVNNVDELQKHLDSPEDVIATLQREMQLNPHVVGGAVAFVPDRFPKKGRWFEPYARRTGDRVEVTQIGSAEHDYLQADWYRKGMETASGGWSEPYFDEAGAKALLCTYVLPVRDADGRTVAVYGADISLEWLSERLSGIDSNKDFPTSSFILGHQGEFLAHPDSTRVLRDSIFNHITGKQGKWKEEAVREMISGEGGQTIVDVDNVLSVIFFAPLLRTGWTMGISAPLKQVFAPGLFLGELILVLMAAGLLVAFFLIRAAIRRTAKPLKYLSRSAEEVARGHFDTPLPKIEHNDEIRNLRDSFENMQHSLSQYVEQLTAATADRVSMERELEIAKSIQMSMLPKDYPAFPDREDIDVFGQLTPAKAVGGDLYDFFLRDGRLYFCIGDVSGKGVPASLVMAATSTQFRLLASGENQPERIVRALNESFAGRNETMMFVTLFVGVLDLSTGELAFCNAGHNAPVIVGPDGAAHFLEVKPNLAIGVIPDQDFEPQRFTLTPGANVILYTDGLTEAEDPGHALFGEERILEALQACGARAPEAIVAELTGAVRRFANGAEQSDDLTMLAVRYR